MKKRLYLLAIAMLPLLAFAARQEVTLTTAGTLSQKISAADKYNVDELKVSGPINGADILLIRDMAGVDVNGEETDGILSVLDLSDAQIVGSNDVYYKDSESGQTCKTSDNEIGDNMFADTWLENVKLPLTATRLGEDAFGGCFMLTHVELPDGLTYIGTNAFEQCLALTAIVIPNSVTNIDSYAFQNCKNLTSITLPDGLREITDYMLYQCTSLRNFDIPSTVVYIGNSALFGMPVVDLHLPASLRTIGNAAFNKCTRLQHLYVDEANTTFSDENGVLFNKDKTTLVKYPQGRTDRSYVVPSSVKEIGYAAFSDATYLQIIGMPGKVETIGNNAFFGCATLKQAILPETVTSIGSLAFMQCSSLNNVEIPAGLQTIGDGAFLLCEVLPTVDLSQTQITELPLQVFYGCYGLTSVSLPATLTYINRNNFYGCSALTSIKCDATVPPTCEDETVFTSVSRTNCKLVVPEESVTAYQTAAYWREFTQIVSGIKSIYNESTTTDNAPMFRLNGQRVGNSYHGVVIQNGKKIIKK